MKLIGATLVLLGIGLVQAAPGASHIPKVSLYYESLCPYCHSFFLQQLAPTYEKLKDHIEVELVPFGNVRVSQDAAHHNVFQCQHGEAECYGNRVHACGLEHIKDKHQAFNFVKCNFGAHNWRETHVTGEQCARQLNLDWTKIKACVDGAEGEKLIEANWQKTAHLQPRKTSVPWITIDGKHTDVIQHEARNHLHVYLCQHYLNHDNVPQCKH